MPSPTPSPATGTNPFALEHFRIGALGDSISRGMSIASVAQEDVPLNWSTGRSLPGSHLNLLAGLFQQYGWSVTIDDYNLAVSGDTVLGASSMLAGQAAQLALLNPHYVTLEIGANDVCQGNLASAGASSAFKAGIVSVLNTLVHASKPPAVIAVASIPNIWALQQIPSLANAQLCQLAWQTVCPNFSVGASAFLAQWMIGNQAIADAVAAVGGNVAYDNGAVSNTVFSAGDVALDCFHPSQSGQTKLAQTVWSTVSAKVVSYLGH